MLLEVNTVPGMTDPIATMNRSAGALFERLRHLHAVVVAAVEGAAMGGGFGLACTNDIATATADALPAYQPGLTRGDWIRQAWQARTG